LVTDDGANIEEEYFGKVRLQTHAIIEHDSDQNGKK
jgi:hypothetical protein